MDKKWKTTPNQKNEGTKGGDNKNKRPLISQEEEEDFDKLFAGVKERKRSKNSNGEETEDNEEAKDEDKSRQSKDKKLKKKKQDSTTSDLEGGALPYGVLKSNIVQIVNPEAPVERVDPETGYRVYKAHLLKVGEGGGTLLCPFDCSCCF